MLLAGGVFALAAGLLAYRKMDDREQVALFDDVKTSLRNDSSARRRLRDGGVFIAFEGGEGCGQVDPDRSGWPPSLRNSGRIVVETHEPGATEAGARIRELLLHHRQPLSPRAEALLFAADRAHHVDTVIAPGARGEASRADRPLRRLLARLPGRGPQALDRGDPPDVALGDPGAHAGSDDPARHRAQPSGWRAPAATTGGDKLEAESLAFHESVRRAFLHLAEAEPRRYRVIDANRSPDDVAADVLAAVTALLSPAAVAADALQLAADHEAAPVQKQTERA